MPINISRSSGGWGEQLSSGVLLAFQMWKFSLMLDVFPPSPTSANGISPPPSHCDNQKCSHTFPNTRWKGDAGMGWESLILHPEQARHKRLTAILFSHFAQRTLQIKLSFYPPAFINNADIINYQNTWNLSIRNDNPKMIQPPSCESLNITYIPLNLSLIWIFLIKS